MLSPESRLRVTYRVRHSESDRDREVWREAEKGWDTKKGTVIKIHRQRRRSQQGQRYRAERQAEGQIPDRQGKGDGKRVATEQRRGRDADRDPG